MNDPSAVNEDTPAQQVKETEIIAVRLITVGIIGGVAASFCAVWLSSLIFGEWKPLEKFEYPILGALSALGFWFLYQRQMKAFRRFAAGERDEGMERAIALMTGPEPEIPGWNCPLGQSAAAQPPTEKVTDLDAYLDVTGGWTPEAGGDGHASAIVFPDRRTQDRLRNIAGHHRWRTPGRPAIIPACGYGAVVARAGARNECSGPSCIQIRRT